MLSTVRDLVEQGDLPVRDDIISERAFFLYSLPSDRVKRLSVDRQISLLSI